MNLTPGARHSAEAKREARGWEASGSGRWNIFAEGLKVFQDGHAVVSIKGVTTAMGGDAIVMWLWMVVMGLKSPGWRGSRGWGVMIWRTYDISLRIQGKKQRKRALSLGGQKRLLYVLHADRLLRHRIIL